MHRLKSFASRIGSLSTRTSVHFHRYWKLEHELSDRVEFHVNPAMTKLPVHHIYSQARTIEDKKKSTVDEPEQPSVSRFYTCP